MSPSAPGAEDDPEVVVEFVRLLRLCDKLQVHDKVLCTRVANLADHTTRHSLRVQHCTAGPQAAMLSL